MVTNEPRERIIVFVDCDGVLNNQVDKDIIYNGFRPISKNNVRVFNELIEKIQHETGIEPECVLSSTWRLFYKDETSPITQIKNDFDSFGCKCKWIGVTPRFCYSVGQSYPRGIEIDWWINKNCKGQNISFIILDDDRDMEKLSDHLVHVTGKIGLHKIDIGEAMFILNKIIMVR